MKNTLQKQANNYNRLAFLLLCLVGLNATANGASLFPQYVSIDELIVITREKSPRFAILKQQVESANADVITAGTLPNPRISYGRNDLITRHNTMYDGNVQEQAILEVPVLIAGQRGARLDLAEKDRNTTVADIQAQFSDLLHQEWYLFIKQLADKQRISILQDNVRYLEQLLAIVSKRLESGNASQYDLLKIDLETKAIRTRLETLNSNLSATAGEIGVLLGLSGWQPLAVGTLNYLNVSTNLDKLWNDANNLNPKIETTRRQEIAAAANLEKAKIERWPIPSVQIGSVFTEKPYGNTTFAGIAVDLPLFDRGEGMIAKANARQHAANLEYRLISESTRGELERLVEQLTKRHATRINFENTVIQKLEAFTAMGEASYRLGKGSLLELLDASRSRTDIQLTHIDLMQAEIESELDVLKTTGALVNFFEKEPLN